ncbi:type II secretion system pilot lipoprotein GspS [Kalamiella sp. sgz302252]|uniref:type II secretion system pilot lipoprotein GspS n=1 Tax=Pantoea sp. sgz302252 TaxID=3341827 RepID=UPI0036D22B00
MTFFRAGTLIISVCFTLSGCQHAGRAVPEPARQVEQLSALIAGGNYLREQCAQTNLPDANTLTTRALALAEQRGWDRHAADYHRLVPLSAEKERLIAKDPLNEKDKCQKLQDSLALFIAPAAPSS